MTKNYAGGFTPFSLFILLVLLAACFFAGYKAGTQADAKKPRITELYVDQVMGEHSLSPHKTDVVHWSAKGGTVEVTFAGKSDKWPCKETFGKAALVPYVSQCSFSPPNPANSFSYSCNIDDGKGNLTPCPDPELGPVSDSSPTGQLLGGLPAASGSTPPLTPTVTGQPVATGGTGVTLTAPGHSTPSSG